MTVHFEAIETTSVEVQFPDSGGSKELGWYAEHGKRLFDIALIVLSLPIVLPLLLIVWALLSLSGGDAIFAQPRVGRNHRVFTIWKFRTMVHNADAILAQYLDENAEARREWDLHQKLKHDPRVTPFGRFLRKSSLDELPQLLNVLTGDMSLVGPRPMLPEQQAMYPGAAYYLMRPGITGFWQISDRNNCSFSKRAFYDAMYARSMSFATDLRVLVRTLAVVFRGTGC
jgi:lipopolysaccharide/colanic/teichoic acid biosynthesis glycosyltransferase